MRKMKEGMNVDMQWMIEDRDAVRKKMQKTVDKSEREGRRGIVKTLEVRLMKCYR